MKHLAFAPPLLLSFALALSARADADAATAAMRAHFAAGVRLYDAKDYDHALEEFRAAHAAKPVAAIERNIALSLKAVHRYAEALDALERFVEESGQGLQSAVRDAAQTEMRELATHVATVRVRVSARGGGDAPAGTRIGVDGAVVPVERAERSVHLDPGEHSFAAHAEGFGDAETRRTLSAGEGDAVVAIELAPAVATPARLHVHTNVPRAEIAIDGVMTQHGAWSGAIAPGEHRVQVGASGYAPVASELTLAPGEDRDLPLTLTRIPGASDPADAPRVEPPSPPPYERPPAVPPPPERRYFAELGLAAQGETLRPTTFLGGDGTTKETWSGGGLSLAFGWRPSTYLSLIAYAEFATAQAHFVRPDGNGETVGMGSVTLAPGVRFNTTGEHLRWVAGLAGGLQLTSVSAVGVTGGGGGVAMILDTGIEVRFSRLYLAGGLVFLLQDTSPLNDSKGDRLFADGSAGRLGLRGVVGYAF